MIKDHNKLVLGSDFGGLGDHLFLTPIPRLYKKKYPYSKVFLSSRSKFRSWEIYTLIWQNNPYLDGLVDDEFDNRLKNYSKPNKNQDVIEMILEQFSLSIPNHKVIPEIYNLDLLKPPKGMKKFELIDMNYISYIGAVRNFEINNILEKVIKKNSIIVNPKKWITDKYPNLKFVKTNSLLNYASLIYSADKFYVLPSGGSHLALALNTKTTVFYGYRFNNIFLNTKNENIQISNKNLINFIISEYFQQRNLLRYDESNKYINEPLIFKILLAIFKKIFIKVISYISKNSF